MGIPIPSGRGREIGDTAPPTPHIAVKTATAGDIDDESRLARVSAERLVAPVDGLNGDIVEPVHNAPPSARDIEAAAMGIVHLRARAIQRPCKPASPCHTPVIGPRFSAGSTQKGTSRR